MEHARALLEACGAKASTIPRRRVAAHAPALEWADCGAMALTGEAEGKPRFPAGALASAARGAGRVIEAFAPRLGDGARDWPALLGERAAIAGLTRRGRRSAGGAARLLPARDGWLAVNLPREDDWALVPAWLEIAWDGEGGGDEARWRQIARALAKRPAAAVVDRARLMGLAVASARRPGEDARAFFRRSHDSIAPGGDASERVGRGDARSIRVLDLTALWAGPLATSLLVEAGWDVIKVESPMRPDGARRGDVAFFDLLNGGKRSASLDLRDAASRAQFEALLEQADVVVESARPRALAQLGYDATAWVEARPGRLWASITGYGRAHEWIAFGDDAACAAGLAWPAPADADADTKASADEGPIFTGDAIADPLTGLHVAATLLAHRAAGRGGLLDFALRDVAARAHALPITTAGLRVESSTTGPQVVDPAGARHPIRPPRARAPRGPAPPLAAKRTPPRWRPAAC